MKIIKYEYLIELLTAGILILIFIYLPDGVKILLRRTFTKLQPKLIINTHECSEIPLIKYIHPLRGEVWIVEDSNCLALSKNDLIVYERILIGKVIEKKENYSIILPVYNKDVKLKVKVKTKNNEVVEGIFQGMGGNKGMVFFIPASFDISNEEKVYTVMDEKNRIYGNLIVGFVEQQIIERNQTVTLVINTNFNLDTLSREKVTIFSY